MSFSKTDKRVSSYKKEFQRTSQEMIDDSKKTIEKVNNWSMGDAVELNINELKPFSKHKFVINEDKVNEYAESIKDYGLLNPIIVWDKNETESGSYEILAGHHRVEACKKIEGFEKIPAIIKSHLTMEDAISIVNQTNMMQRAFENLPLYEKCDVINQMKETRQKLEERRPELKREPNEGKERKDSTRSISREFGVSKSSVAEYLTLYKTYTKKQIECMEDTKGKRKIFDIKTGLVLSQLPKKAITELFTYFEENEVENICKEQGELLVESYNNFDGFKNTELNKIILRFKENKEKNKPITFKREDLKKYFPNAKSSQEIMEQIIEMLESRK